MHTVRTIRPDEFRGFLDRTDGASYQQTSEWSRVRSADWDHELVGWFDSGNQPVAAAVIRYRRLPGVDLRFAYIPQDRSSTGLHRRLSTSSPLSRPICAPGASSACASPPP